MTNYVQEAASSPVPLYGSGFSSFKPDAPSPLHWRTFPLPKSDPDYETAIGWELKIDDLRAGLVQRGDFARGGNQYDGDYRALAVSAGVDPRWRRHLTLAHLKSGTTFGTAPANVFHYGVNYAGTMVMAAGSTANFTLYKETSDTDPTPIAVTYTPAGLITSLSTGVIGGATNSERLFVGQAGAGTQVHDTIGTSAGTMHANTAYTYGIIMSPVNASSPGTQTMLIYALNTIYTLAASAAIGTAPTAALTGIQSGGYAIGIEQVPKNWPLRAYWMFPDNAQVANAPMLNALATGYGTVVQGGKVYSTNLEGTDRQVVPLPLPRVYFATRWQRQIVASDGNRVVAWNGDTSTDLRIFNNRKANSNTGYRVVGLGVRDADLYALVLTQDYTTVASSTVALWLYVPDFDSWLQVSSSWPTETGAQGSTTTPVSPYTISTQMTALYPQLPISTSTGFCHVNMRGVVWNRQFLPPAGHNSYYLYRLTATNAYESQQFETTGQVDTPYFELPTLEGRWKKIDQLVFGGEITEGNVQVTINPNEGGRAYTFSGTDSTRTQPADAGQTLFQLLQVRFTLNQGSSTRKTPNALPVTIRGRAYLTDPNQQGLGLPGGL